MQQTNHSPTDIGQAGEQLASEYLVRHGYEVVDRNWKTKLCEIDIIATKNHVLYFIEVKYRATRAQGDGFDYVTDKKLWHMRRAAEMWVQRHNWTAEFELLAVSVVGATKEIDIREVA